MATLITSGNDLLFVLFFLISTEGIATAGTIRCPNEKLLSSSDIFDGPPSERASLISIPGGWVFPRNYVPKEGYYLQCTYQGTAHAAIFRLPPTVTKCLFDKHWPIVACQ